MICERCGFKNVERNHCCVSCGARMTRSNSSLNAEIPAEKPRGPWSRPSLLGLGEDAAEASPAVDPEPRTSHWRQVVILAVALAGCCLAGWHWRNELRGYMVAGLAQANSDQNGSRISVAPATGPVSSEASAKQSASLPDSQGSDDAAISVPAAEPARSKPPIEAANLKEEDTAASSSADLLEAAGEKYLYGTGVPIDCSRAQESLAAASERGNAEAETVLGTMYTTGHCVSRDLPLAYKWFSKARRQTPGDPRLQHNLQMVWDGMTAEERQIVASDR